MNCDACVTDPACRDCRQCAYCCTCKLPDIWYELWDEYAFKNGGTKHPYRFRSELFANMAVEKLKGENYSVVRIEGYIPSEDSDFFTELYEI